MAELPVSQKYYNQTLLISEFISHIKKEAESGSRITDVHFAPFVKGYDITFMKGNNAIRLSVSCRKVFDGCILKIYEDNELTDKVIIKTKDDIDNYITRIMQ